MKRNHGHVSQTPAALLKRGKTSSRMDGPLGTPVEGLTSKPIDTPESDDRPNKAIPETTQRRLEGFCLNTPLSLSQTQDAETPTFGKEAAAPQQQQQQQQDVSTAQHNQQQHAQVVSAAVPPTGRHRLANISNLQQPEPGTGTLGRAGGGAAKRPADSSCSDSGLRPMMSGGSLTACGRRRHHHVMFQQDPGPSPGVSGRPAAAAAAAGPGGASTVHRTPHPSLAAGAAPGSSAGGGSRGFLGTPGSCYGEPEEDFGFVLHTSQTYVRHSQPAISPNAAAGLSSPAEEEEEEEPFTTPSQDSREPRLSPSNATSLATTTLTTSFEVPPPLGPPAAAAAAAAGAAAGTAVGGCSTSDCQGGSQQPQQQQQGGGGAAAAAAVGRRGSVTPGDGLGLLLGGIMEETTTPELEQVGVLMASQEAPGGSQQQQPQLLLLAGGAAAGADGSNAAAAAAAAAGGGSGAAGASGALATRAGGGRGGSSGKPGRGAGGGGGVVCEEVTTKQVLFPIFRPKSQRKCVILVRHGESTYNKQDAHGRAWADPHIFDAPLTARGRQQAIAARDKVCEQLERHGHLGPVLWLTSPLTRAMETMLLAAPQVEQLAAAGSNGRAGSQPDHKVMVLSMIAEHCATSGDVGRPASQLATHFPALADQLAELPEQWWYNPNPQENPNCAVQKVFNKVETVELMRRRVSEFSRWLRHRDEPMIVAFGHSTFWKYFANTKTRLRNCEVLQFWW